MEGTLIGGRYRLSQPIGRGRGGFEWIAQDTRVHRTVAAKPIALRGPQDASFALQQAKRAARIRHQCVVTVYDVLVEGTDVWMIMEYVPSRTLADFMAGHERLDPMDVATLGVQLAAALAAAHEAGLLHRAVEPPNVLLADDGGVQITDFGIGALHGDPAYQAPEVVAGGGYTDASDVFSLGATLCYAAEGSVPFDDRYGWPGPPLTHLTGTPLHHVLMRMLSADPALRPSMAGVWAALKAVANGRQPDADSLVGSGTAMPAEAVPVAPVAQPAPPAAPPPAAAPPAAAAQPAGVPQGSWPEAGGAQQVAPQTAAAVRPSGLPAPLVIGVAILLATLAGVLFTELLLL